MTEPKPTETFHLLKQWHEGDRQGLERLLERDREFVQNYVNRRLSNLLKQKADPEDYVQEAMIKALEYTPRFLISDRGQFRQLIARITENILCDHAAAHHRQKRDVRRERPAAQNTECLRLDPPHKDVTRPSTAAQRDEDQAWIRLGLELLPRQDRLIVRWRTWENLSFKEIGDRLEISDGAAQMRFQRILPRLAKRVLEIRNGGLTEVIERDAPGI